MANNYSIAVRRPIPGERNSSSIDIVNQINVTNQWEWEGRIDKESGDYLVLAKQKIGRHTYIWSMRIGRFVDYHLSLFEIILREWKKEGEGRDLSALARISACKK